VRRPARPGTVISYERAGRAVQSEGRPDRDSRV